MIILDEVYLVPGNLFFFFFKIKVDVLFPLPEKVFLLSLPGKILSVL